ncbi:hypothetical protein PFISCL1PPCAC_14869, partial [Pristionchus fissidentatus]
ICLHIFSVLAHHSSMSKTVKKYNKMMTQMLMIQVLLPCIFLLIPVSQYSLQVSLKFESSLNAMIANEIFGLHSLMHSIALIITSKNYRLTIERIIFKV